MRFELQGDDLLFAAFPETETSPTAEDAEASAHFSIVVPIHDAPAVTRRSFASLERYAPQSEIIVVDDASVLSETLELVGEFKTRNSWTLIRHNVAQGHSAGCRDGGRESTKDYICFLNSDTVVTPWCWRLVKEFRLDPAIGTAGPSPAHPRMSRTLKQIVQPRPVH